MDRRLAYGSASGQGLSLQRSRAFIFSTYIWLGFLIKIITIYRTLDNRPLEFATVRHFLLNLSVSLEFLLRNQRLARVSTPPYAFGSSFNAPISIRLGFLIKILQIYETLDKFNRFHLLKGSRGSEAQAFDIPNLCNCRNF
jgi:hypothetical protein